jgi:CDP-paratose 2-epimerase
MRPASHPGGRPAAWGGDERPVLITGGAGFIGTNVAHRLATLGRRVVVFDNLSRAGVERNLDWLQQTHAGLIEFHEGDVRNLDALRDAVTGVSHVYHFAAQVAVTTSLVDPFFDFDVNARGTLNLLEAIRACDAPPSVLFTSTNKVYGDLHDVPLRQHRKRYEPIDERLRARGVDERRCLDFHSPYGCSKGVAEQYVLDYARTFGLRAVVFRMSCIYGPHQCGSEDQGWVAHFLIAAAARQRLAIYGDGMQVRDILFVDDLVEAMTLACDRLDVVSGQAFNIGGGPANTTSLLELMQLIGELQGAAPLATLEPWRSADQRYYVSNTGKFREATGWIPRVDVRNGVRRLHAWLKMQGAARSASVTREIAS